MEKRIFKSSLIVISLLLISISILGVIADNSVDLASNEVEILDEEEVEDELLDIGESNIPEDVRETEGKGLEISRVSIGEGFVIKGDESDANFFRGTWNVKRFIDKLEDLENNKVKEKSFGSVVIGVGNEKEKFKLEKAENNNSEEVVFNLIDKSKNIAGIMKLKPKKYERVALWFGELKLDSGNYIGSWKITAVVKTKLIKPKIKTPPAWQFWKFKERKESSLKEKVHEKLFEEEGAGEFIKQNKGKDLKKVDIEKRKIIVDKVRDREKLRKLA